MTVTQEELLPAIKRFNRWQFTETQNMFRDFAVQTDGPERSFLNALGDTAGGFSKIWHKGGEPHAMVDLLTTGIEKLRRFCPSCLGIELNDFVASLQACLEEAKRWRRGDTEIFNRDLLPRIFMNKTAP